LLIHHPRIRRVHYKKTAYAGYIMKPKTNVSYTPLIDLNPYGPYTILTAITKGYKEERTATYSHDC
jgi:hypothetical protein